MVYYPYTCVEFPPLAKPTKRGYTETSDRPWSADKYQTKVLASWRADKMHFDMDVYERVDLCLCMAYVPNEDRDVRGSPVKGSFYAYFEIRHDENSYKPFYVDKLLSVQPDRSINGLHVPFERVATIDAVVCIASLHLQYAEAGQEFRNNVLFDRAVDNHLKAYLCASEAIKSSLCTAMERVNYKLYFEDMGTKQITPILPRMIS